MLDPHEIRPHFPALSRRVGGLPAAYLDGPGGTQVPHPVIDSMAGFLRRGGGNLGGFFTASTDSEEATAEARSAVADFFNASSPGEIVFGQNMTSLTFAMSRALARTWSPGDEVVVTSLDHDANISPWQLAAAERGAEVRRADFDPEDGTLDPAAFDGVLSERTRLVAVTAASNALGTIVDVARVAELAHQVGAVVYVDAVHYAPHRLIDVQALDCDFLVASAYKFFGPHTGALYGKQEHLEQLEAFKVRPAPDDPPEKWETGTQSFESLAGVTAAVDYLASLGEGDGPRRRRIETAMERIRVYESGLAKRFLDEATATPGVRVYGPTGGESRTPTFALAVAAMHPDEVAHRLGERGIFAWSGHYYAVAVMERLGVSAGGGLVRIGFVHYNTDEEVGRLLEALRELAAGGPAGRV